jgi:hypothetical protein
MVVWTVKEFSHGIENHAYLNSTRCALSDSDLRFCHSSSRSCNDKKSGIFYLLMFFFLHILSSFISYYTALVGCSWRLDFIEPTVEWALKYRYLFGNLCTENGYSIDSHIT